MVNKFLAPLPGNGEELGIEFCINCVVNYWSFLWSWSFVRQWL